MLIVGYNTALVETKHVAPSDGGSMKQSVNKHRPRTDNCDYLLPKSSLAYLDVIDDTGQLRDCRFI